MGLKERLNVDVNLLDKKSIKRMKERVKGKKEISTTTTTTFCVCVTTKDAKRNQTV